MPAERCVQPIGVFDSGVGGLSVLRHIRAELPAEDLIYIADSGHAPYGERSQTWIRERSLALAGWLAQAGCKALVVACNTATAAASSALRERWPALPIVAMEPAVKPAAAATRSGVVGVLATVGTLSSARFAALLDSFGRDVTVLTRAGHGLVECVEAGELDSPATRALLASHLEPLLTGGADTIVLGCTHYPFLRPLVQQIAGPDVAVIDTGAAVARQLVRRLDDIGARRPGHAAGSERMLCSGDPRRVAHALGALWPAPTTLAALPAPLR